MRRARVIFDDLTAPGSDEERWTRIEKLVADSTEESLWLDFKANDPATDPLKPKDPKDTWVREKLARALSGYANTEGGTLIYGIETKPGSKDQPDAATKVSPLTDARRFRAGIEKLVLSIVDPLIPGVVVEVIAQPGTPAAGVVLVFVPESAGGPHRIVGADPKVNDRYMMRTATSHMVMPHRTLADRFGRAATPQLQLTVAPVVGTDLSLNFVVTNHGRGAARRPALQIINSEGALTIEFTNETKNGFRIGAGAFAPARVVLVEPMRDIVIYPGMSLPMVSFRLRVTGSFECVLHALEMQPVRGNATFEKKQVLSREESLERAVNIPSALES